MKIFACNKKHDAEERLISAISDYIHTAIYQTDEIVMLQAFFYQHGLELDIGVDKKNRGNKHQK